jgi:hypothetical protein
MEYTSPELVVVGRTEALVLGVEIGPDDNPGDRQLPDGELVLGLDD